jgi:hypothetical protein
MGETLLVFTTDLWFVVYHWLLSEKYKIVSWKKKEFKFARFFYTYFIIVTVSLWISTVYYLL